MSKSFSLIVAVALLVFTAGGCELADFIGESSTSQPAAKPAPQPKAQPKAEAKAAMPPVLLLEVNDATDPVEVGKTTIYRVTVYNQGTTAAKNVKLVCKLDSKQQFVTATGVTQMSISDTTITSQSIATLNAGAKAQWMVTVKAAAAGDCRFTATVTADGMPQAISEPEATMNY